MYYGLGIAIMLAGFFVAHAVLALSVWLLRPMLTRWLAHSRPTVRAQAWLLANVGPATGATIFSLLLATSFILFEPANTNERIGWLMALTSLLALVGWFHAGWQLWRARRATRDLVANWAANATPISIPGWDRAAFRLDHVFPLIAVVGVRRPRLFLAGQVLDQLGDDELVAAIAHENGHLRAGDNLKRMLVNFCGAIAWWVPGTDSLRGRWADAAELAADEFASAGAQPLDLASALVKLARMTAAGTRPAMPAGAFLVETAGDILTQRVNWLVDVNPATIASTTRVSRVLIAASALTAGSVFVFGLRFELFAQLHQLIEAVVKILQP